MWQEACPLARRLAPGEKIFRRQHNPNLKRKIQLPMDVVAVPREDRIFDGEMQTFDQHVTRKILYVTKWASALQIGIDFKAGLKNPAQFFKERKALVGVYRFFGNLSRGRMAKGEAAATRQEIIASLTRSQ